MRLTIVILSVYLSSAIVLAQREYPTGREQLSKSSYISQPIKKISSDKFKINGKKVSQYTKEDWGAWIDSTWGPGQTAPEQLDIFDAFWSQVNQYWAGFPNLSINYSYWDSVRDVWRPQIGSGLSRGRFYAVMSRMWLALRESHTYIYDLKIDSSYLSGSSFYYRKGVPLLLTGPWGWDLIGAPITTLSDSTNVVYRAAPGNPLDLQPGDVILGYDGIPWKNLCRSLLDAGVPVSSYLSFLGSTPESMGYAFLAGLGFNWGLFDTIDVVKYSTGDTLHLPTALLDTLRVSMMASDQVPIAGVPMPVEPKKGVAVSWGVVQGTNVGYIYVWDWATTQTRQLFQNAVNDLVYIKRVEGLVLDFRMNMGGYFYYANEGLGQLFNFDPDSSLRTAKRNSVSDRMSFGLSSGPSSIAPLALYDHPIAVLIGPGCWSAGDYNAYRMHLHPMARLFGRPTNGAFVAGNYVNGSFPGGWKYNCPSSIVYSNLSSEGYLIHKGLQPDEEVWLTRDGVAKGEDDVAKRALQWINTLSYAHNITLNRDTVHNATDSIRIDARVKNPLNHALTVTAYISNSQGATVDSTLLRPVSADTAWSAMFRTPQSSGTYYVSVKTYDSISLSYRTLSNVASYLRVSTEVKETPGSLPLEFALHQNYPNPFNPSTTIQYELPKQSFVTLKIFDVLGREVAVLVNEKQGGGSHSIVFNADNLPTGIYFFRLNAFNFTDTKKMLLVK